MSITQLSKKLDVKWPEITAAGKAADLQAQAIRQLLKKSGVKDSADFSVVVFGSFARREWTADSDLDWTLLVDGPVKHQHAITAHDLAKAFKDAGFKQPGQTGVFGNLAFSHNIIHQIGGTDDSNRNTTQRMLLLLESRALTSPEVHQRVIREILRRYLQNDLRAFRLTVPLFLLNDMHRFWRTMCVDYASKYRERAGDGWAIRNIKLRMSRKLIFVAGLLTCYRCNSEWIEHNSPGEKNRIADEEAMVQYLLPFMGKPPLDILGEVLEAHAKRETAIDLLDSYDRFLGQLGDGKVRRHLEKLPPGKDAEQDKVFRKLQAETITFGKALERLFFDDSLLLARLTRFYGVF